MSIQTLQRTGHAIDGFSCFNAVSRVSRPLSWVFGDRSVKCLITSSGVTPADA
jgi:hypothetical protein